MFSFGSGVFSWNGKKQPIIRNNQQLHYQTQRQNTKVGTIVTCEVGWLQKLFSNLGQSMDVPIVIYCDNIHSILLGNNLVYHVRTKHIEVHYHFIREKVLAREINLIHVSTEDQIVDIFTKAFGIDKLKKFRKMFGVLKVDSSLRGGC
jgi:hypothetical protein